MTAPGTPAFEARASVDGPTSLSVAGVLRWPGGEADCAFGRSGLVSAATKREGDGATPIGAWFMREVYFRPDRVDHPLTRLPVTAITPAMGWCDDPAHAAYNRPVSLPFPASHETLWRADGLYDLIVILGYNDDPPVPGGGSAIFLHCAAPGFTPTEGCVAIARAALLDFLATAGPDDALTIAASPSPA